MSGGHSGSLFQLSTTDDSREASHTRGLAAGVPPLPSHPRGPVGTRDTDGVRTCTTSADTHRRPCACLPSAWRRLCCWDNSFNLPGFNRATYDGTLVELGVERHEFDELKRRVCDATDGLQGDAVLALAALLPGCRQPRRRCRARCYGARWRARSSPSWPSRSSTA